MTDVPEESKKPLNLKINEQNSIIQLFLNQFKFKESILTLFSRSSINISPRFLDASILFIFLAFIFAINGLLKWEFSTQIITLGIIALFAIIELIGTNTPLLKKFFDTEKKTRRFLENLDSIPSRQIEEDIKYLNFSSANMNYLLSIVEHDKNKIPPHIVEKILISQDLTKENLDRIFTQNVLNNLRETAVITLLYRMMDKLTSDNILAVFTSYRDNEQVLKVLFATQYDSKSLLKSQKGDAQEISAFFEKFQVKKEQYDLILKIIPIKNFKRIETGFLFVLWLFFSIGFLIVVFSPSTPTTMDTFSKLFAIFVLPALISSFFTVIFVVPILNFFKWRYKNRFLRNVMK